MKFVTLTLAGLIATATAISAQPADKAPAPKHRQVCLQTSNIDHLSYPDDKTILFHMRGGKVRIWKNTLKHACPNMKFQGGIAYDVHGGTICGNMQMFTVIQFKNVCMMGSFSPYTPPKKKDPKPDSKD